MKSQCAGLLWLLAASPAAAIEIPLDAVTPVRVGFVDLQKVFDTYPEKSFAEGDLLRELEKRRRDLTQRQAEINTLRGQIEADTAAAAKARAGQPVVVPVNTVAEAEPPPAPEAQPAVSTTTVVEPYPMEDPLAGLPGHEAPGETAAALPGLQSGAARRYGLLDDLAAAGEAKVLDGEALTLLEARVADYKRRYDRQVTSFKVFRQNAIADMKQLQAEKTYGVMSRIYAILQQLARDENVMLVVDKAYVLYGEDAIDLSDRLIARLQALTPL